MCKIKIWKKRRDKYRLKVENDGEKLIVKIIKV